MVQQNTSPTDRRRVAGRDLAGAGLVATALNSVVL
jgi:hypothetical protein